MCLRLRKRKRKVPAKQSTYHRRPEDLHSQQSTKAIRDWNIGKFFRAISLLTDCKWLLILGLSLAPRVFCKIIKCSREKNSYPPSINAGIGDKRDLLWSSYPFSLTRNNAFVECDRNPRPNRNHILVCRVSIRSTVHFISDSDLQK